MWKITYRFSRCMVFGLNKDEIDQFGEKRRGFKLPYREN